LDGNSLPQLEQSQKHFLEKRNKYIIYSKGKKSFPNIIGKNKNFIIFVLEKL